MKYGMEPGVQPGEFLTLKQDHPVTSFVAVSSAVASQWLAHNTHNRPISEQAVLEYQLDMEAGRFKMTGEPLQFSKSGVLLNGQNRLTALANCVPPLTLVFNVIRGLDEEAQAYMDMPKKRSPGQQLGLLGYSNANQVASLVRVLIVWDSGMLFGDDKKRRAISTPRIEEWVHENEKLISLFNRYLVSSTRKINATPAVAGAVAVAGLRIDPAATIAFFHLLNKRVNLGEDSPILALDNRLRRVRAERFRLSQRDELAYFITTWNLWMHGDRVQRIQGARGGWTASNFPVMETQRGRKFSQEQFELGLSLGGYTT